MPRIAPGVLVLALGVPLVACSSEAPRRDVHATGLALAESVSGKLDAVSCLSIMGWAQDTAAPDAPLAVEVTFDAPLGDKADGAFAASLHRDDLCQTIGSCKHSFDVAPPYSLFDGEPHGVFVYADDVALGEKRLLDGSGALLTCPAPAVSGAKRPLPSAAATINWRLDEFWHAVWVEDAELDALPTGTKLPERPLLVRADDGSPTVWLLEAESRRPLADPATIAHWRFDPLAIEERPAAEIAALPLGPPLRSSPMIVRSSLDELFLIDEPASAGKADHANTDSTQPIGKLNDENHPETRQAACAARFSADRPSERGLAFVWAAIATALALRKRRSRNDDT